MGCRYTTHVSRIVGTIDSAVDPLLTRFTKSGEKARESDACEPTHAEETHFDGRLMGHERRGNARGSGLSNSHQHAQKFAKPSTNRNDKQDADKKKPMETDAIGHRGSEAKSSQERRF